MVNSKVYVFDADALLRTLVMEFLDYESAELINGVMFLSFSTIVNGKYNQELLSDFREVILRANVLDRTENTLDEILESAVEITNHLYGRYRDSIQRSMKNEVLSVKNVRLMTGAVAIHVIEGRYLI